MISRLLKVVFVLKCLDLFKENASSSSPEEFVSSEIQSTTAFYFCHLTLGYLYICLHSFFRTFYLVYMRTVHLFARGCPNIWPMLQDLVLP